jgi:hypothetical protein
MNPNLKIGTFSFDGFTSAVPEPSRALLFAAGITSLLLRRRRVPPL